MPSAHPRPANDAFLNIALGGVLGLAAVLPRSSPVTRNRPPASQALVWHHDFGLTRARERLRHTGATWMADAGIPLHVLQRILGHKSIETTHGYLHPNTRHLTDATARTNAFLDGHENPDRESPAASSRATAPLR